MVSLVPAMPLILAVEPDRKQADAVETLARGVLRSEVVVTDSADAAIAIMAKRVPDLLLTSLLLPPRDEARIAERLRELDAAGTYVQTLVIPMLAVSNKKATDSKRRLWKSRGNNSAPDGCAPEVFAGQISEYLRRASVESVSRARAAKAELDQELATPAPETTGLATGDASYRHLAEPQSSNASDADGITTSAAPAAIEAAAAKQLLADRHAPKRRTSLTPDPTPTARTSDVIKAGHAAKPAHESVQEEPAQRVVASAATGSNASPDRLNRLAPPKPQERVPPEPRPSGVSERLSRLAAPKPVVVPPEPSRPVVDRPQAAPPKRIFAPDPPRRVLVPDPPRVLIPDPPQTPPEERHEHVTRSQPQPPVAARVESPAHVAKPVASASPAQTRVTTAASSAANQPNPQPADKVMQPTASGAANEPDRTGVRQKVVLGALDIGAFVQELTSTRGVTTSGQSTGETNLPGPPQTAAAATPQRLSAAANDHVPSVPEQTPPPGNGQAPAASPAEQSRAGRPKAPSSTAPDDWGIFDPQHAGFAALFAKLEEISDQDDPGKDPTR
jgi:CheY-like chemotaxis protein